MIKHEGKLTYNFKELIEVPFEFKGLCQYFIADNYIFFKIVIRNGWKEKSTWYFEQLFAI